MPVSISNNLSELDTLLAELNSARFIEGNSNEEVFYTSSVMTSNYNNYHTQKSTIMSEMECKEKTIR